MRESGRLMARTKVKNLKFHFSCASLKSCMWFQFVLTAAWEIKQLRQMYFRNYAAPKMFAGFVNWKIKLGLPHKIHLSVMSTLSEPEHLSVIFTLHFVKILCVHFTCDRALCALGWYYNPSQNELSWNYQHLFKKGMCAS